MADTYHDHPGRLGMVPLDRVIEIITRSCHPVYNAQSLSELDRHLETILGVKATIIRHLNEAFPK